MKALRMLASFLVWIVAALVGLVGVILCLTILLLPLGIPVVLLAGRLFGLAASLLLPREVRHPVKAAERESRHGWSSARDGLAGARDGLAGSWRSASKRVAHGTRGNRLERLVGRKPKWRRKLHV